MAAPPAMVFSHAIDTTDGFTREAAAWKAALNCSSSARSTAGVASTGGTAMLARAVPWSPVLPRPATSPRTRVAIASP